MSYTNPFLIFQPYIDKSISPEEQLPLLRKKILAEISLSADGYIQLGAKTFTKDDILKYFEELKKPNYFKYYELIANDAALHGFLSGSSQVQFEKILSNSVYREEEFIRFISPVFKENYIKYIVLVFESMKPPNPAAFSDQQFLTATDKIDVISSISKFLEGEINTLSKYRLKAKSNNIDEVDKKEIIHLTTQNYIAKLNFLPSDFDYIRDSYALEVNNLAVALIVKERNAARRILENAMALSCNDEMTTLISSNHDLISKNHKEPSTDKSSPVLSFFITIVIIISLIIKISKFTSNNSKSNNRSRHPVSSGVRTYNSESEGGSGRGTPNPNAYQFDKVIDVDKMLVDLMATYKKYHTTHNNNNKDTKSQTHSISNTNNELNNLQSDARVIQKYKFARSVGYSMRSLVIKNNSNYDVMIFFTQTNNISVLYIAANEATVAPFCDISQFRFYIGKNFDETKYIEFMGRKIPGIFNTYDTNSSRLINAPLILSSVQSLQFYEEEGKMYFGPIE